MARTGLPTYYKHKPVDTSGRQIRLLELAFLREDGVPPTAQLKTYDIDVAPPYIALSYTRGEPTAAKTSVAMRINGSLFWISQNLRMALSQFQRTAEQQPDSGILQLPIWVDEICIDQRDVEESNQRPRALASIYRNAQSVIVWLSHIASTPGRIEDQTFATEILQHEYFTGLWIVQEVLLARDLYLLCGKSVFLSWSEVEKNTLSSLRELHRKDALRHRGLLQLLMRKTAIRSMSLQDCISRFCYQQCSNPLDKVFGLMSLVAENEQVVVDYDRSIPEVFLDVVRLLHSGDLALGKTGRNASGGSSAGLNRSILEDLARQMGLAKRDVGLDATRRFLDLIFKSTSMDEDGSREITHRLQTIQVGYASTFSNVVRIPNRWWVQVDGERRYIQWVVESSSCLHTALSSMAKNSDGWIPRTLETSHTCNHRTCKMSLPTKALPAPPITSGRLHDQDVVNDGPVIKKTSDPHNEQSITAHNTLWMAGGVTHVKKADARGAVISDAEKEKKSLEKGKPLEKGKLLEIGQPLETGKPLEKGKPSMKEKPVKKREPLEKEEPFDKGETSRERTLVENGSSPEKGNLPQPEIRRDLGIRGRLFAFLLGNSF